MEVTNFEDGPVERDVLIGMIVSNDVLARISPKWVGKMFPSDDSNTVAGWCIDYYRQYERAPMVSIQTMFAAWAEKRKDETTQSISRFLAGLSDQYKQHRKRINPDYIVDQAGKIFNRKRKREMANNIIADLNAGKDDRSDSRIDAYTKVDLGVGACIDLLQDEEAILDAFAERSDGIVTYDGALGEFFRDTLERDGFIAFTAPEKRGKSFWLLDMAWRAMLQRRRVAYFQVGDLSRRQVLRRFGIRAACKPRRAGELSIPTKLDVDRGTKEYITEPEVEVFDRPVDGRLAWRAFQRVARMGVRSNNSYFKLFCYPNATIGTDGIDMELKTWARQGWSSDVVIIDYADVLKAPPRVEDKREKINETWKALRSLSQAHHCLLVTATQSDAKGYDQGTLNSSNFSDDKRKNAHVTGNIGINQTEQEKKDGVFRLNWLELREDDFIPSRCVYTAGCIALANPAMFSGW